MDIKYNKKELRNSVSKEDVERNLKNVEEGKPLDLPLSALDGQLKVKSKAYIPWKFNLGRERLNARECFKHYVKGRRKDSTVHDKVEWCLWFLYYYQKHFNNGGKNEEQTNKEKFNVSK